MNILPHIAAWLAEQDHEWFVSGRPFNLHPRRTELVGWLKKHGVTELELAADAMIAAGIGVEQEQGSTVYCRVTY